VLSIDLHAHSTASDGLLSPASLIRRAAENGVGVLALTEHDETCGIAEAREAAAVHGIRLVAGVEISVTWRSKTVHIVGIPLHWGFTGAATKGFGVNMLTPYVGDANIETPEYKAFLVDIEPVSGPVA
jgi:predicted metal-dependent phosphoesterase TrpH